MLLDIWNYWSSVVCESVMLGTISTFYEVDEVLLAVGITVAVTFGLTLFSFQTKVDFTRCGGGNKTIPNVVLIGSEIKPQFSDVLINSWLLSILQKTELNSTKKFQNQGQRESLKIVWYWKHFSINPKSNIKHSCKTIINVTIKTILFRYLICFSAGLVYCWDLPSNYKNQVR